MNRKDRVSRLLLVWMLLFTFVLFSVVIFCCGALWILIWKEISPIFGSDNKSASIQSAAEALGLLTHKALIFGLPLVFIVFLLWGVALWAVIRRTVRNNIRPELPPAQEKTPKQLQKENVSVEKSDIKADRYKEMRLFVYWLTAFQREGRFIDFLFEELKNYSDEQVGATVRIIQESCKKILLRHVAVTPVTTAEEGNDIVLEKGFDPQTFQLVGDIRGEPPFKGVIRHRGWKVIKWEIPDLSGDVKPEIVMPAEVEIR
jgi:hypothetical protein